MAETARLPESIERVLTLLDPGGDIPLHAES
jgi:hypothetical protein